MARGENLKHMLWAEAREKYGEMGKMTIPAKQYSRLSEAEQGWRWEKSIIIPSDLSVS